MKSYGSSFFIFFMKVSHGAPEDENFKLFDYMVFLAEERKGLIDAFTEALKKELITNTALRRHISPEIFSPYGIWTMMNK